MYDGMTYLTVEQAFGTADDDAASDAGTVASAASRFPDCEMDITEPDGPPPGTDIPEPNGPPPATPDRNCIVRESKTTPGTFFLWQKVLQQSRWLSLDCELDEGNLSHNE